MSDVVLVRHGETVGESSIRLYGATDIDLSERGREQMLRVRDALAGEGFRRAVVSPLRRSRESASIILGDSATPQGPTTGLSQRAAVPDLVVVEAFREIDFGRWEGWSWREVVERDPEGHRAWASMGPDFRFPGGEARLEFENRVARAVPGAFDDVMGPVLAVLHKGVIKVVLATLLGIPREDARRMRVDLGAIYRVRREGEAWRLAGENLVAHLGPFWVPDGGAGPPARRR